MHFRADIRTANDYSAFGALLDDRQWYSTADSGVYRFGCQGWERSNNINGNGNSYFTEFRLHDTRLARTWSIDPENQFHSPYVMLGNSPINGIDPDGAYFWEASHIRQARQFAKLTGGEFSKWKDSKGKRHATVRVSYEDPATKNRTQAESDLLTITTSEAVIVNFDFHAGENRSQLLLASGSPFYETMRICATGWGRVVWHFKSGDAWAAGHGEYRRKGQAPVIMKVVANLNGIVSAANGIKVLFKSEDIYGVEASSPVDYIAAIAGILSFGSPGKAFFGNSSGPSTTANVIDMSLDLISGANEAGGLDNIKKQKSQSENEKKDNKSSSNEAHADGED